MLPPCIDLSPSHQTLKSPPPMFLTPVGKTVTWDTFQDPDTFEEHYTEENKKYKIFSQELRNKLL